MKRWLYFISMMSFFAMNISTANGGFWGVKKVLGMHYGEDAQPPHAPTSITGPPELIPSAGQNITYTDFKKATQITEGDHVMNITYGVGDQRIKTVLSNASGTLTRYYAGNYEEEIRGGNTRKIHYINGGNGLAALYVQNAGKDTLYYTHTDYQGSLLALSLTNGAVIERYAYDPWGKRRNPMIWQQADTRTSFIIHRGYTMHEHLPEFNLINMNGRVYDPLVAQFLSTDPYVQAPGNWINYNRYAYAFNNPLIYTDPSGEYVGLDDLAAAVVGGLINLGVNIWQGNIKGDFWTVIGKGAAAFGAGAVGGLGALYPEFGGWAWGGATVGATNAWLGGAKGWDIAIGAGVGVVSSCVGGLAGQWGAQYLGGAIINGTSITSPVLQGAITGTAGGAVGGYASSFTAGLLMTGDLSEANSSGWKGAAFGAPIGGISGFSSAYRYSVKNNIDPLNGKSLTPKYNELNTNQIELKSVGAKGTSINKINDSYLKQKGIDAEAIKYEYLGNSAKISRLNLYQTPSGQIIISDGKNIQIPTDYFVK